MHINFYERSSFEFNIKALKKIQYKDINLQRLKLNRLIMLLVAGGLLFTMLSFGLVQKLRLDYLLGKKATLDRKISKINAGDEQILDINGKGSKEDLLKAYHHSIKWSQVLNKVVAEMPPQVWLKGITGQQNNKRIFSLSGEAPDQQIVASLIDSLERTALFHNVRLISSELIESKEGKKLNFRVNCIVKARL